MGTILSPFYGWQARLVNRPQQQYKHQARQALLSLVWKQFVKISKLVFGLVIEATDCQYNETEQYTKAGVWLRL